MHSAGGSSGVASLGSYFQGISSYLPSSIKKQFYVSPPHFEEEKDVILGMSFDEYEDADGRFVYLTTSTVVTSMQATISITIIYQWVSDMEHQPTWWHEGGAFCARRPNKKHQGMLRIIVAHQITHTIVPSHTTW